MWSFKIIIIIFLKFIFACAGSLLLCCLFYGSDEQGLLSSCGVQALHCGGFSCGAQALGPLGISSCGAQAQ